MKSIGKWLLVLLLLGGAAAGTAVAYEHYVAGPAREKESRRADAAQALAAAARDAAVEAQRTTLRVLARDSARADSMRQDSIRIAGLEVDSASLAQRLAAASTPQETVLVVINVLDSTRQALAICKGSVATCERRIQDLRDSALAAHQVAMDSVVLANDSLVASNDGLLRALHPPLTFPRLALKVGRYAEHGLALYGGIKLLDAVIGGNGESRESYPQCQVVSPLTLSLPVPWGKE